MLDVRAKRFDHEVRFASAAGPARFAIGHLGPNEQELGEISEPVNVLHVAFLQRYTAHGRSSFDKMVISWRS
jgi:hypothetical protein